MVWWPMWTFELIKYNSQLLKNCLSFNLYKLYHFEFQRILAFSHEHILKMHPLVQLQRTNPYPFLRFSIHQPLLTVQISAVFDMHATSSTADFFLASLNFENLLIHYFSKNFISALEINVRNYVKKSSFPVIVTWRHCKKLLRTNSSLYATPRRRRV